MTDQRAKDINITACSLVKRVFTSLTIVLAVYLENKPKKNFLSDEYLIIE